MAIAPVTVTFNLVDFLGYVPDPRRTKVILETNVASGFLVDTTTGGSFRLTDAAVTIDSLGVVSFSVLPSGATGLNPTAYQIHVRIDAANPATREREKVDLGWYTITAAANLKDLVSAQYVPPTYLTAVTTLLDGKVAAAQTARTGAEAARDVAQAFVLSDLGTTDGQTRALIQNPASQTAVALSATYAQGISVKDPRFGAVGDGVADDSAAIQAAINAVNAAGGGEVYFPKGTYRIVTTLIVYSNVTLRGAGRQATILKLGNSANTTILRSESFATLTGTNPTTAPYGPGPFSIRDMTFDGNKANNTSGWCAQLYAWDFTIERVSFREGKSGGLYSEWSNSFALPPSSMEAQLVNVKAHDNGGRGIDWNGPHDSLWTNVVSFLNASDGIRVGANGSGLLATNCHSWGAAQPYAWVLDGDGCVLAGCVGEGAITGQVLFTGDRNEINGGYYYAAGSAGKGFLVGKSGNTASDNIIRAHTLGFVNGSIDFTYDGGGTIADIVHVGGGTAFVGTLTTFSRARIDVPGVITHELGGFAWADYVPTLTASTTNPTLGAGSSAFGSFRQVGKTVHVRGVLAFGTGSTPGSGTYYVGLPVPRRSGQIGGPLGYILDASAGDHRPVVYQDGGSTSKVGMVVSGVNQYVTHAVPWAWADGDVIRFAFTYEAA